MERALNGSFTECLQGVNSQSHIYVTHANINTTTQILTSGSTPSTLVNIAQGEVFTYVWSANNHGYLKAQQNELYRDPYSFSSTTTAATPETLYSQWINKANIIAVQRPFADNEIQYPLSNPIYNRAKCADFTPTDGTIWASIYNSQNGPTAMTQNKFCWGQAKMPEDMPVGPQRFIYHFWHEDSTSKDWVSVQYVNVVKAGTKTQKSGYAEADDGTNFIAGSYGAQGHGATEWDPVAPAPGQITAKATTTTPTSSTSAASSSTAAASAKTTIATSSPTRSVSSSTAAASAKTTTATSSPTITSSTTSSHVASCIVTLNGAVFDAAGYVHPGGAQITDNCDNDISNECADEHGADECTAMAVLYLEAVTTSTGTTASTAASQSSASQSSDNYTDTQTSNESLSTSTGSSQSQSQAQAAGMQGSYFAGNTSTSVAMQTTHAAMSMTLIVVLVFLAH